MNQEPFVIERVFNASIERVWNAITDSNQMKFWYFDLAEFRAEVGYEFSFTATDHDCQDWVHLCRVTEVIPHKKIAYTWQYQGYEAESLVTWELFPEGNQTRLRLTHAGLHTFPPIKALARENFEAGWNEIVGVALKEFLETPAIRKHVRINTPVSRVWEMISNHDNIRRWAEAFSPGTFAETDWKVGSEIIWKDGSQNVGARGRVTEYEQPHRLKFQYWDNISAEASSPLDKYTETFSLKEDEGGTSLLIEAGPLSAEHVNMHNGLWEKAIALLKSAAEESAVPSNEIK